MIAPKAIDLFAGLGGFSEGARRAGYRVIWAANHSKPALDWHQVNHTETEHKLQDLRQADFTVIPRHNILLASPSCRGHSLGRGKDKPRHDAERATAWAVIECAEVHREEVIVIENVVRFLRWELWPVFKMALEALGYAVAVHVLDAADHGVPSNRARVIIVCTRSKAPLFLKLPRRRHVGFDEIMDQRAAWSLIRKPSRSPNTLARIKAGRREFGPHFVMPYYSNGSGLTGRSMRRPLGTITTVARWAVVDGDRMRMVSVPEYRRAMSFPASYLLPDDTRLAIHLLGNAIPPLMAEDVLTAIRQQA